jgi:hypothetical protein
MGTVDQMLEKIKKFQEDLENLSSKPINIIPDANGMIDLQCPKKKCNEFFKINNEDWSNIVKDDEVFCPFCRKTSKAFNFIPVKHKVALVEKLRKVLFDNWNFETPMSNDSITIQSKEKFEIDIQCSKCKLRYSVIGSAYFCPCCGNNNTDKNAKPSIEKFILMAKKIDIIQKRFEEIYSKDDATIFTKTTLENLLSNCIGTLQSFNEFKYKCLSNIDAPFNAFQNVEKGNKLWLKLKGEGYETWLNKKEVKKLLKYTQWRHLLEHKSGIVDSKYISITNDKKYLIGDRIIVKPDDILILGRIVTKIIEAVNDLS